MQMDLRDPFHSRERRMEDDMSAAMSPLPAAVPDVSRPRRAGQTPGLGPIIGSVGTTRE